MIVVGALLISGLTTSAAWANRYAARQYYSGWSYRSTHKYYYRTYYYKPTPTYYGYKHHYVIHYPSRPQYNYYYNPYKKVYWGRCPSQTNGTEAYSLLAEADRRENLEDIPEKAFPKPGKMPAIPESQDGAEVDLPPDDLPPNAERALPRVGG